MQQLHIKERFMLTGIALVCDLFCLQTGIKQILDGGTITKHFQVCICVLKLQDEPRMLDHIHS